MIKPAFYITILLFSFVRQIQAQENLVPNGSFEEMSNCPGGIADFSVLNWYSPTWGTCDYFNTCNILDSGVPSNYFGNQNAKTGNGYVGFASLFDSTNPSSREYIQVELTKELDPSKLYHFSCSINKSDSSSICVSEIGVAFSNDPIGGAYLSPILVVPQITSPISNYVCDEDNWSQIEGFFHPIGGEKYLTIGYFKSDDDADTIISHYSNQGLFAYYYVDNVFLIEETEVANIFSPNEDGINDLWQFPITNFPIQIFNRWGNLVKICEGGSWDGKTSEGNVCSDGVYFYHTICENCNFKGFIQLIR